MPRSTSRTAPAVAPPARLAPPMLTRQPDGYGALLAIWLVLRLPETLAPEQRRPLSLASVSEAIWMTVRIRQSIGNTIAQTLLMGVRVPSWQVLQELRKSFTWSIVTEQEEQLRELLSQPPIF